MNETLSSSLWPNFSTSRPNLSDQFSLSSINPPWQLNISTNDIYSPDDYSNVWSAKSNTYDENEKESIIKSIWSTSASPNNSCTESNSHVSDGQKNLDETPTNSPSLKRTEIINCNDRWGNVKINQVTPWSVVEIDESEQRPHDPMVWRAKIDGTEVWEDYYMRQHGRRLPQTDTSFNSDNVWSSASEISQSTNSIWPPNKNEINVPSNDIFSTNLFSDINNRPSFTAPNGVRPSMTRNQAQKYLIDMGYSLSDAIGALVNNQMDLPKAINELQSKYRMSTTNCPTAPNGMYTPTLSFNNSRPGDNVNMTRIPPGTPINSMIAQNNPIMPLSNNYSNSFDIFHQDVINDQGLDSSSAYMTMDNGMTQQYGRLTEPKRQTSMPIMTRDNSFRNTFPNSGRPMVSNNCGQQSFQGDMSVLGQGMGRMNLGGGGGYNPVQAMMSGGNGGGQNNGSSFGSKWLGPGISSNSNGMMVNGGMDPRQNYGAVPGPSMTYGRSIAKQPHPSVTQQQHPMYQRNPGAMGWHGQDQASMMSPGGIIHNGPLNDISQVRLAKNNNISGTMAQETSVGIIIRKVPSQHIEMIKSICYESGTMTNFQLQPHTQSILVYFSSSLDARRCMSIIQSQINVRVDLINDDYVHCLSGANCL